ncbi:MAG: metallophosphoesterase family protein [Planctomycetota bacterium]
MQLRPTSTLRLIGPAAILSFAAWSSSSLPVPPASSPVGTAAVPVAPPRAAYPATASPDRVVLTLAADPATTVEVCWRTDASVAEGVVEFARATPGPKFVKSIESRAAATTTFGLEGEEVHRHHVQLSGLEPETAYVYRVGSESGWSEWYQFRTASAERQPFRFVYFGDAQNRIRDHWSRVVRGAALDAPDAAFLLHAGDLVNVSEADAEWGEWFGAGAWLNAMLPQLATPGNHEYRKGVLSSHWRPQFAFPENGPEGLEETVYWLDYQGVRFVSLNTLENVEAQIDWLPDVLAAGDPSWTVVFLHFPLFSAAKGRDNAELRAALKPIFDEFGVDLVLQGHDHAYMRTGLETPLNVEDGAQVLSGNTVYVVSVSGPKMYTAAEREFARSSAAGVQLYQVIDVEGEQLRYRAHSADGPVYDAFVLHREEDGTNSLEEIAPETAEGWR